MSDNYPNFDGEEMKLPSMSPGQPDETKLILSLPIIIALFIGLLVILAGIIYLFYLSPKTEPEQTANLRPTAETNKEPETPTATAQIESMGAVSTSDEITAIEADLESTLLDSLDTELLQIEAELNAEF